MSGAYTAAMITFLIRRWHRRAFLRAWAQGDLVDAGFLGRSTAP